MNRKWFQLHLSTLLIVTFAAALLLWKNFDNQMHFDFGGAVYCGWPWPAVLLTHGWPPAYIPQLLGDLLVSLSILGFLGFHCEYYTRLPKAAPALKRKWLQFHLMTLLIVLLILGVMVFLNFTGRQIDDWYTRSERLTGHTLGFPFECGRSGVLQHFLTKQTRNFFELNYDKAMMNLVVMFAVLFFTGLLSEFFIYRREAPTE